MRHTMIKCTLCNEVYGCQSEYQFYLCAGCAWRNPCVRARLRERLDVVPNGLCRECKEKSLNEVIASLP